MRANRTLQQTHGNSKTDRNEANSEQKRNSAFPFAAPLMKNDLNLFSSTVHQEEIHVKKRECTVMYYANRI